MRRLPTYFISHGGGPWPWLDGEYRRQYDRLDASLQGLARDVGTKPRAILVVSGHWEEDRFTVQSGEQPGMIYDYGGFPEHTYRIRYASPGAPEVARRVQELLGKAGIEVALDAERGYSPRDHLEVGRALRPLRDEGVLIVASGLSYHNLRAFGPAAREPSQAFDGWLDKALAAPAEERIKLLTRWDAAPASRIAHPREDHFIPLHVALGAAEDEPAYRVYHERDFMGGVTASSYRFGRLPESVRKAA